MKNNNFYSLKKFYKARSKETRMYIIFGISFSSLILVIIQFLLISEITYKRNYTFYNTPHFSDN